MPDFKNGAYTFEIKDSLSEFGLTRDSLNTDLDRWYVGQHQSGSYLTSTWEKTGFVTLRDIQKKPVFTISNITCHDTIYNHDTLLYIKLTASANINKGELAIFYYKNSSVSCDPAQNYGLLNTIDLTAGSPTGQFMYSVRAGNWSKCKPGDSLYFAFYPASYGFGYFGDHLLQNGDGGYGVPTSIGGQKIVLAHKLHY